MANLRCDRTTPLVIKQIFIVTAICIISTSHLLSWVTAIPRRDLAASQGRGARCALSLSLSRGRDGVPSLPAWLSTWVDCPQCAPPASRKMRQGSAAMSATHLSSHSEAATGESSNKDEVSFRLDIRRIFTPVQPRLYWASSRALHWIPDNWFRDCH